MSTRGWSKQEVLSPRGAWTDTSSVRKGTPARASVCQNLRINTGIVTSREGTAAVFSSTGKVTGMTNWLAPPFNGVGAMLNFLYYQDGTVIKSRLLATAVTASILTGLTTTRAPVFAELGPRLYFCGFDTTGTGTIQCRVHDGLTAAADVAFRGPLTFTSFTAADNGVGLCTKGTHKIAFVFQSRSGFAGQPSPVVATVFTPASVTLNAGLRSIRASITLDTPADAGTGSGFFPIMTRADNPNAWFFVPEGFYSPDPVVLPASTAAWAFTVDISISDEDLANRAESADDQFNRLVAGASSGPFNPGFVVSYGKRMCYGVGVDLYVSEIDDPQAVTADFNKINLPSQRHIGMAFPLGQALYLTGDKWTGRTSDNGDLPSTWPQPEMISDALGGPFPGCVEWKTAGSYAWVAASAGLYVFTGAFPSRPISFLQADIWGRINWAAAYAIQIADDIDSTKVYVAVPLDSATEPSHVLVYDYTNGLTYDTCDFSLYVFNASVAATFSSIRVVKEPVTDRSVLYVGPSAAGSVLHFSESTHNDVGTAVDCIWESGYVRNGGPASGTIRVGNALLWLRGAGPLIHTWKGLDGIVEITPVVMSQGDVVVTALSAAPGIEYFAKGDLSPVENYTLKFRTNSVDGWLEISGFTAFDRPALYVR